jgi:hypothetical protein
MSTSSLITMQTKLHFRKILRHAHLACRNRRLPTRLICQLTTISFILQLDGHSAFFRLGYWICTLMKISMTICICQPLASSPTPYKIWQRWFTSKCKPPHSQQPLFAKNQAGWPFGYMCKVHDAWPPRNTQRVQCMRSSDWEGWRGPLITRWKNWRIEVRETYIITVSNHFQHNIWTILRL